MQALALAFTPARFVGQGPLRIPKSIAVHILMLIET